jgi:hypothetical protein
MKKLYKTTLIIWSETDPNSQPLNQLIDSGYISYKSIRCTENPYLDPHCDFSEYFEDADGNS